MSHHNLIQLPKKLPVSSPSPIPGKNEVIAIIAGTAAGAGPTTTGATTPAAPAAPAPPAATPPAVHAVCRTDTRGPIRVAKDGDAG